MPVALASARSQLLGLWLPLGRFQKISIIVIGVIAVVVIGLLTVSSTQTTYTTVFTKLPEAESGAIAAKLKETKIPYELADGGTTIKVPSAKANEVRIEMAKAGLPQNGGVGFELFDKTSFGLTDFNQKLNFQRALEGELGRTIGTMNGIENARVHLVFPKAELFSKAAQDPTASVVLKLKPGTRMDSGNIRAIANLVTGAIEGLKPANINILDSNGNVLWDEKDSTTAGSAKVAQTYLDARAKYERDTEIKILTMLDKVLGPNRATAKVSADMDWDQVQTARELVGPAAPRSSREITERFTGNGTTGGVPGVTPNIPGSAAGANASGTPGASSYEKRDITTNFELTKTVESIIKAPGSVRKMSVAVFIDNLPDPAGLPAISQAVSNAAGIDQGRGDTVTVSNIVFDRTAQDEEKRASEAAVQQELYLTGARAAAVALALIVSALFLRSLFGTRKPAKQGKVSVSDIDPRALAGSRVDAATLTAANGASLADAIEQAKLKGAIDLALPMTPEAQMLEAQIQRLVQTKPHELATIIQDWLDEDE